jgi:hypothetical protein
LIIWSRDKKREYEDISFIHVKKNLTLVEKLRKIYFLHVAHMFLFVIDGAMVQLLDPNKPDERERLLEYFLLQLV